MTLCPWNKKQPMKRNEKITVLLILYLYLDSTFSRQNAHTVITNCKNKNQYLVGMSKINVKLVGGWFGVSILKDNSW